MGGGADYGHRAFLELGGVNLLFEAIRRSASGRIPYGASLDETLGGSQTNDFLRRVLRQTSEGLQAGRSTRLIRDQIQADLGQRFETAQVAVLLVLLRHLGITRMLVGQDSSGASREGGDSRSFVARAGRETLGGKGRSPDLGGAGDLRPGSEFRDHCACVDRSRIDRHAR